MSRILLFGGTGAMGVYLRDILAQNGHDVWVTSRLSRSDGGAAHYLQGNARDATFAKAVLSMVEPDAIVDFMIYGSKEFADRCHMLLNGTGHYLFLSSYRVFNCDALITERSPRLLDTVRDAKYLATDEYALSKARSEDCLRNSGKTNWTIIRPGITYSKSRFQLGCLEADTVCYRSLLGLPVVMPKSMQERETTLTWGRDVALMISRLLFNRSAYGEDFNCTTAEHHPWSHVCGIYRRVVGTDVRDCSIEDYIKVVGNRAQVLYDRMFDRVMDNSKVLSATGLAQSDIAPVEMALEHELSRFKANSFKQNPNVILNARIDNLLGTRIPFGGLTFRRRLQYWGERSGASGKCARVLRRIWRPV